MARTIGATTCIWLPRGLTRDYDEFGAGTSTSSRPWHCTLHWQANPGHPDHEVSVKLGEGAFMGAGRPR